MFEIAKSSSRGSIIRITRGDYGKFKCVMNIALDPDHPEVKTPYEMQEGDKIVFTVRKEPKPDSPVLLNIESLVDFVVINPDDTKDIPIGEYSGDAELITADGKIFTFWPDLSNIRTNKEVNFKNFCVCPEVSVP